MRVKDLIKELEKYDKDMLIGMKLEDMEMGEVVVSPQIKKSRYYKETKEFTDAFDYGKYTDTAIKLDYFNTKPKSKEFLFISTSFDFKEN
jgi:hypothetical protein